ncbi:hypothetical protein HG530_000711 [Fusarium avenaceum]|nr:hypothetical protein HG530_000711 [Fusarium avenaceum]
MVAQECFLKYHRLVSMSLDYASTNLYTDNSKTSGRREKQTIPLSGDELLRVLLLLLERLRKCCQTSNNTSGHEKDRNDGPDDTPALRGAAVSLGKHAGVGRVYFPQDQIVADIPHAVQRRHDTDEEDDKTQSLGVRDEPAGDEQPDGEKDGHDREPISLSPPESQEEAYGEDDAGYFAGDDVEAAEREQGADDGRAQIAGG